MESTLFVFICRLSLRYLQRLLSLYTCIETYCFRAITLKVFLLILAVFTPLSAQQRKADSLETLIKSYSLPSVPTVRDSVLVQLYANLATALYAISPDKTLKVAEQGLALARQIRYRAGESTCLRGIGVVQMTKGQYDLALQTYSAAKTIDESTGDKRSLARVLNNIGLIYGRKGKFGVAIEQYFQALPLAEAVGDKQAVTLIINNIGIAYKELRKFDDALEQFRKSLGMARAIGDKRAEANALGNMGNIFEIQNKYQEALEYNRQILTIREQLGDKITVGITLDNIGRNLRRLRQYAEAEEYSRKSLRIREETGDKLGQILSLEGLARILYESGKTDESLVFALRSLALADSIGATDKKAQAFDALTEIYERRGEYATALKYERLRGKIADSLLNADVLKQTAELRLQYEDEKKRQHIVLLEKENQVQILALAQQKAEGIRKAQQIKILNTQQELSLLSLQQQEAQLTETRLTSERDKQALALAEKDASLKDVTLRERNTEISRQRVIQWSLAAILLGAIIAAAWLGRLYQQKRIANQEILRQQAVLQDQATEIELINTELHETNIGLDTALHDLKATQSQLVQSERMSAIGMLTAGVMHEINNPNAIAYSAISQTRAKLAEMTEYFLSMLDEESKDSAEVRKFQELSNDALSRLELAADGSQRVKAIVANLQGFSKHQENDVLPGDWAKEIRGTVSLFQLQYQAVNIEVSIPATLRMQANFGELNQVLLNMLVNATQAGATALRIHAEETAEQATVSIADNGKGIPPEVQAHIFEPFFSTKGVGNSGLGLSISKQIVERHGGQVRCESEGESGTTFILELPKEVL
ncbi:MAG: hypothetical protein EAZ92_01225 [Candidatus Kapaibacterium sp.]|nr:MAG: hypothetical protein EAZ92_01225 [Candidatus Kapabacteria bacterium]